MNKTNNKIHRYLFLNCDGVINCDKTFKEYRERGLSSIEVIDYNCVANIAAVVHATDCKIYLSSSWRIFFDDNMQPKSDTGKALADAFAKHGIKFSGKTPRLDERSDEINVILDEKRKLHGFNNVKYLIIDDETTNLLKHHKNHIIKTNFHTTDNERGGFLFKHIPHAIDILS